LVSGGKGAMIDSIIIIPALIQAKSMKTLIKSVQEER